MAPRQKIDRVLRRPTQAEWGDDEQLTLPEAARLIWPEGPIGVSALRKEINRGRLPAEKIANRLYVTLAGIREMRARSAVIVEAPAQRRKPSQTAAMEAVREEQRTTASLLAAKAVLARIIAAEDEKRRIKREAKAKERAEAQERKIAAAKAARAAKTAARIARKKAESQPKP